VSWILFRLSRLELRTSDLRKAALIWLCEPEAANKATGVLTLGNMDFQISTNLELTTTEPTPGRPAKPELVSPLQVKKRSMRTVEGRAALIHALAHIEFNAINLALDAIWRFANMPEKYYRDWLKVAREEAHHFSLLNAHLQTLGYQYGDFSGHNSLWEMVDRTKADVLARMALVPTLRAKLAQAGDMAAARILDITLRDEVGHVSIGNFWFNYLCEQRGLEPIAAYEQLAEQYDAPKPRPPFNLEARREAGFSDAELARMI
jgi:uncharacterized ferritin-like protein (DUF455 family)